MSDDGSGDEDPGDGSGNEAPHDGADGVGADGDPVFETGAVFDPETYLHFYADRVAPERSEREAAFVAEALDLSTGDRVLDVPCGHGRLANPLADRGCRVVGIDVTPGFLSRGRADARDRGVADRADYARGDMRALPFPAGRFDAAFNAFTSFGYFDDAGNRRLLAELARVLRPGGRVLVDVPNLARVLADFDEVTMVEEEGDYLVDRHEYDPRTGRMRTDRLTVRDGQAGEATFSVRQYTYPELVARFEDAGFAVVDDYGDLEGEDYSTEAPRTVLVGELAG